jgi:AcrR family transcriptional regulator
VIASCETVTEQPLPRREARKAAILEAAAALFSERGYGATSLSDVVKLSGGSLATLYDLFGNKQGLFRALIEDRCRKGFEALYHEDVDDLSPREGLSRIGGGFFRMIHSPTAIAMYRMIIAEGAQIPELPVLFYETGPSASHTRMAEWFEERDRRGQLRVPDPVRASIDFCGLLCAQSQMRLLIGLPVPLTDDDVDRRVAHVVDLILRAYAPAGS